MALDVTVIQQMLGNTTIGIIPAWMVGILAVIVVSILIVGWKGDKAKMAISLAPVSALLMSLGFQLNLAFILLTFAIFGVIVIMGSEFKEHTVETE